MRDVTVSSTEAKFRLEVKAGPHTLVADEPQEEGGDDQGPGPFELLGSALASCKAMTVKLYAERKGWPLRKVEVKVHQAKEGEVHDFHCTVHLEGELDAEQRQRLLEIADRCPVHRTLTGKLHIHTGLMG